MFFEVYIFNGFLFIDSIKIMVQMDLWIGFMELIVIIRKIFNLNVILLLWDYHRLGNLLFLEKALVIKKLNNIFWQFLL